MDTLSRLLVALFLLGPFAANCQIKYEEKDKQILENIFIQLKNEKDKSTAELIVLAGNLFLETPYVAHTLESEKEQLVVNLRELDCTTYAENCLAIALTIKSGQLTFTKFAEELTKIRYRNGHIDGYVSRLHYFSDWIFENEKKGLIKSVSKDIGNIRFPLDVNFMSTHPDSYQQLKKNPNLVSIMAKKEKEICARQMFYIPENKIAEMENKMQQGDIVGLTTSIDGLDILHVGILVKKNGRIHLMHASSAAKKVVVSDKTLEDYLKDSNHATGVMVVRMVEGRND